jgi:hypothetical protein
LAALSRQAIRDSRSFMLPLEGHYSIMTLS